MPSSGSVLLIICLLTYEAFVLSTVLLIRSYGERIVVGEIGRIAEPTTRAGTASNAEATWASTRTRCWRRW